MLAVPLARDEAAVAVADGNRVGAEPADLPLQIVGLSLVERRRVQARRRGLNRQGALQASGSTGPGLTR
jgi:hypothetical protein